MQEELIIIGKIIKSQGNKGEVLVNPLTDDPHRFEKLENIYLQGKTFFRLYKIENVRYHKNNRLILKFAGCNNISDAQALVNANLAIKPEELVDLPENSYFHFQIIGMNVYTSENEHLGEITEIFPTGSNDVYVVRKDNQEVLLPAIKEVILQVDLENKKMIIKLPKGLK